MTERLNNLPGIHLTKNPVLVFLAGLLFYTLDNVVNYFMDLPIFATASTGILIVMWLALISEGKRPIFLFVFSLVFLISSLIGNLRYDFHQSSISDLVFILTLATAYFYYRQFRQQMVFWPAHLFLVVSLLMFGFAFFGVNSMSLHTNERQFKNLELVGISFDSLVKQGKPIEEFESSLPENIDADSLVRAKLRTYFPNRPEIDTLKNIGIGMMPGVKIEKEPLDKVEKDRKYNYGLFRVPHVPAYFFGFLLLLYLNVLIRQKKKWYLLILVALTFLIMYNGVRTFVVSAGLAVLLWFFLKRNIWYFVIFAAMVSGMIVLRYEIFEWSQNTILQPLSSLLITTIDNPDRLSRVALFRSWYNEMQTFSGWDFLFGKNFYMSKMANLKNLFTPTWYHNDLLSIIFSYGIPAALMYIALFIRIYTDNIHFLNRSAIPFIFYVTMILAALFNGLYYYFPVFLLYIFWLMKKPGLKQAST